MGADAVVGVNLRYEQLGAGINMLLVVATGTAVRLSTAGARAPRDPEPSTDVGALRIPVYRFDPPTPKDSAGED